MISVIQEELALAKSKMIEEVECRNHILAKLSRDNVAIVEAMIRNDSAYIHSTDVGAKPTFKKNGAVKYGGSSAYWMTLLKRNLLQGERCPDGYCYSEIIKGAVEAVDRENSTHLNADGCGRSEITDRLCKIDRKDLLKGLENPDYKEMFLVKEIARITSAEHKPRCNLSFASKFCHYACFYVFEGTEYQDNYSIYDGILRKVLPMYLEYFNIDRHYNMADYKQYRSAVDDIRKAADEPISRNGFDHLLWYYHKGRLS